MRSRRFSAVIFDLDGTLSHSVLDFTLLRNNLAQATQQSAFKTCPDLLALTYDLSEEDQRLAREVIVQFEEQGRADFKLRHDVEQVLGKLDEHGIRRAVITRNDHRGIVQLQEALSSEARFAEHLLVHRDSGLAPKPRPDAALHCARLMDAEPRRVLFVGDGSHDRECADAAGMAFALVKHRDNAHVTVEKHHHVVTGLSELIDIILAGSE